MKKIRTRYLILMACLGMIILATGCSHISPMTKPGAPSNLVGIAISHRGIQLTWQDNSDNEDGFLVGCTLYGGNTYYEIADLPANTTSFVHSGLDPLETFSYYIQAYNGVGRANSSEVEATTLSGVTILNHTLGETYFGWAYVAGRARNDTDEMLDSVWITVWWYDAEDVLLDTSLASGSDIPAGVTWEFEASGTVERANVARYDIGITDVYIWSSSAKESKKEMGPESQWGLSEG